MTSGNRYRRRLFASAMAVAAAGVMAVPAIASAGPLEPTPVGGLTSTPQAPPTPEKTSPVPKIPQTPGVQACNEITKSGGQGVTETRHLLGTTGPASFVIDYETLNQPDEIVVSYEGREIANTGYVGDNTNEGTGSIRVFVPPGSADSVLVRVTGPEEDTLWDYTVKCPDLALPMR